ncbi:MAG: SAF domain-containing protein [Mycobacterium sp.]
MGESLNPTVLEQFSRACRPDFARTVLARRIAAAVLVLLAGVAAWRPDPGSSSAGVMVALRDLSPGVTLSADDVALQTRSARGLPDGALTSPETVLGATLAGPARRGEVLTDVRVLGPRLTGLSAGPDARVVPVHLADPSVADLIRPGDVVDLLGAPSADSEARPRVVATAAVVVLVSPATTAAGAAGDRVVLVALPASAANAVAAATLVENVTLTLH